MTDDPQTSIPMSGQVVLITGAASGIGKASALACARAGAAVACVDRDALGASATAAAIRAGGGQALSVTADLSQSHDVVNAVAAVLADFGRIDGLFNVAGISGRRFGDGPVADCTEEGWDIVLTGNLKSVFLCCKYVMPHMLAAGRGAIVNLASVLGLVGGDDQFSTHAYAASKAGIIGLSRAMAVTYAPQGVRVNVIAPGLVATPMSRRAQADPAIVATLEQRQPLLAGQGGFVTPEQVASTAVYLLSSASDAVTGVVLPVDGGWTAQ